MFVNALKGVQVCFSVRLTYGCLFVVDASVDSMFPFDVSDLDTYFVFLQSLTDTADHVKNYRPKLIVLTGNPATRSHHIFSAQIYTRTSSLCITLHFLFCFVLLMQKSESQV